MEDYCDYCDDLKDLLKGLATLEISYVIFTELRTRFYLFFLHLKLNPASREGLAPFFLSQPEVLSLTVAQVKIPSTLCS